MNDIEAAKAKKENRYGWFFIADLAMSEHSKEIEKALACVHVTESHVDQSKKYTHYTGYSPQFLPLSKGQPPLEYAALMDPVTKKFVRFRAKGGL